MLLRRIAGQSGFRERFQAVNPDELRYKLRPECRGKAQEAVAQMRALGFWIELQRGDLLVFTIEDTVIDDRARETLERVWPNWRECVTE
jgi:hypothetical protein